MERKDANWLANQLNDIWSPKVERRINIWIHDTPDHEAAEILLLCLRRYYENKIVERLIKFFVLLAAFVVIALTCPKVGNGAWVTYLFMGTLISLALPLIFGSIRKGYRKAALLLAGMNDERAIPYLAQCCESRFGQTSRGIEEQAVIDHLIQMVTQTMHTGTQAHVAEALRDLALRHLFGKTFRTRQVTDSQVDLFLCVVRYLAAHNDKRDRQVLERLSTLTVNSPNAQLIVEATNYALHPAPLPMISSQASMADVQAVQPIQQILHRSS